MKNFHLNGKRLFTFGCSFTNYNYPTWADIIGFHYPVYENWGRPSQGNSFILSSVIECHKRNNFTEEDDILILWSGIDRFDFYQFGNWTTKHGAYPHNDKFSCCPDGYEILSSTYKSACNCYLQSKNLNFRSMDWQGRSLNQDIDNIFNLDAEIEQVKFLTNKQKTKRFDYNEYENFLTDLYKRQSGPSWPTLNQILNGKHDVTDEYVLQEIEDFKQRIYYHCDWNFEEEIVDGHPFPLQHLEFVKTYFPNFKISIECETWVKNIELQILDGTYRGFRNRSPKERL